MMFSKTCKYALNAMIFVASLPEGKGRVGLKEISIAINSPEAFTAKILQQLVRRELLDSAKGPHGGFAVHGHSQSITIAQIVSSIDGDTVFTGCALGLEKCSEVRPCPVHHKFKAVRDHLKGMLHTTNLKDIANRVNDGISILKD